MSVHRKRIHQRDGSSISERLNPQPMTLALWRLARRPKCGYPCQGEAVTVVPWGSRCNG
jgi:hypothetical protein